MNILSPRANINADRRSIYAYWSLCVILNASLPFFFALGVTSTLPQYLGVAAAVISFIWIYSEFDYRLLEKNHLVWSKHIRLSAALKVLTLLAPAIEIICGAVSIALVEYLLKSVSWLSTNTEHLDLFAAQSATGFWVSYLITMINGTLLSLFVGLILLLVRPIIRLVSARSV